MKPFAHSHLMAASHHVACVAATMRLKVAAGECQRASEACLAAHRDRDLVRLRECNKVFVSRVAKVHAAVHGAFLRNGEQMVKNEGAPRGTRWVRM